MTSHTQGIGGSGSGSSAIYSPPLGSNGSGSGSSAIYSPPLGSNGSGSGSSAIYSPPLGSNGSGSGSSAIYSPPLGSNGSGSGSSAIYSPPLGSNGSGSGSSATYSTYPLKASTPPCIDCKISISRLLQKEMLRGSGNELSLYLVTSDPEGEVSGPVQQIHPISSDRLTIPKSPYPMRIEVTWRNFRNLHTLIPFDGSTLKRLEFTATRSNFPCINPTASGRSFITTLEGDTYQDDDFQSTRRIVESRTAKTRLGLYFNNDKTHFFVPDDLEYSWTSKNRAMVEGEPTPLVATDKKDMEFQGKGFKLFLQTELPKGTASINPLTVSIFSRVVDIPDSKDPLVDDINPFIRETPVWSYSHEKPHTPLSTLKTTELSKTHFLSIQSNEMNLTFSLDGLLRQQLYDKIYRPIESLSAMRLTIQLQKSHDPNWETRKISLRFNFNSVLPNLSRGEDSSRDRRMPFLKDREFQTHSIYGVSPDSERQLLYNKSSRGEFFFYHPVSSSESSSSSASTSSSSSASTSSASSASSSASSS